MNIPGNPPSEHERTDSPEPDATVEGNTASPGQFAQSAPAQLTPEQAAEFSPQPSAAQAAYQQPAQNGFNQPSAHPGWPQQADSGEQYRNGNYPQRSYAQPATQGSQLNAQPKPRRSRVDPNGVPYGVGPFTLREAVFLILAALVLIASFFPFVGGIYADLFGYTSLWAPAPWLAVPGTLLLTAAATLIVIRRVRPAQRLRVGSLSADQFASAMAITTAGFYVGALFFILGFSAWFGGSFGGSGFGSDADVILPGPGLILGLIFALASLIPTTFAPFTAPLKDDFVGRPDSPAHPLARDVVAVPRRPRPIKPEAGTRQEVHSYGSENTGSVQLTPADARPEDFAAYRRKSWSPEPVSAEADAAPDVVTGFSESEAIPTAGEQPTVSQPSPPETASTATSRDDDVDDFPSGDEPAPVSAVRHVAEQEALGETAHHVPAAEARAPHEQTAVSGGATSQTETSPPVVSTQPFWVYSPVPLPVVDERTGETVFEIGPSAWALAIVDRGSELVIRHDDGRVGVLRQLAGIMRG